MNATDFIFFSGYMLHLESIDRIELLGDGSYLIHLIVGPNHHLRPPLEIKDPIVVDSLRMAIEKMEKERDEVSEYDSLVLEELRHRRDRNWRD